jgi:small subunit ribosomal protein S6
MKLYEGLFILPPDVMGDARKNQMINLENMIQKFNGKVHQRHEVGRRVLGYAMKRFKEGYLVAIDFDMDPASQDGYRKALELQEDVLSYMIIAKDAKQEAAAKAPRVPKKAAVPAPQPQKAVQS